MTHSSSLLYHRFIEIKRKLNNENIVLVTFTVFFNEKYKQNV